MSNDIDETIHTNDDDEQHSVKTKIIKCKTNNQQAQTSSYNILTPNGSSATAIRSIDVPNEHTSIKLHIRRVCSPSSNDTGSINPTTNLLSQQSTDTNEQQSTTKIISRQFFNSNEITNNKLSRRPISTRRSSLIETNSSSIYDLPKPIINNHTNIYDENTLKNQTTKTSENKRKALNDQQDKKRTKLTSKTIKHQTNNNSKLSSAVSHIPQFGDANTSLAGDAVSPAGDVNVSAGDAHL
jgi:hypothetical protein